METVTQGDFASAAQREVDRLLAHYGESHQNPRNERHPLRGHTADHAEPVGPVVGGPSMGWPLAS